MSLTYARFDNLVRARIATRQLRRRVCDTGRVELLRSPRGLSHHTIPLRMTAARSGFVIGSMIVGVLSLLTVASAMWVIARHGIPVPARDATLALAVGLSAMLGGLAGALAFASENGAKCQRVRGWLRDGDPVVLVNAEGGHEETLLSLGAGAVGKIL